jgi:hypothetical protein
MNLKHLLPILCTAIATHSWGAFTISVQIGELLDSNGTLVSENSLWAIIYDADGDGFLPGNLQADSRITAGSASDVVAAFGGRDIQTGQALGDDRILWAGIVNGEGTSGVAAIPGFDLANYTFLDNNVAANGMFGVYWFPGLTTASYTLADVGFEIGGIQFSSPDLASGGDIGMVMPSTDDTGATLSAFFYNETNGGSTPDANFTAIVAIPEPAAAGLAAFGLLGLLRRRRA